MKYKILERNETGTGILIEDAGYVNPLDNRHLFEIETADFKHGSPMYVFAILQKYDTENKNGRWYPKEILEREDKKYQELIKNGAALGQLNHPENSIISLATHDGGASHRITETWWKGKTLMGKLELLVSPGYMKNGIISCPGDQAANLMKHGVLFGISSRGVGTLKTESGKNVVQEDFELICYDLVSSPSTPGAFLSTKEEGLKHFTENVAKKSNLLTNKLDKFLL